MVRQQFGIRIDGYLPRTSDLKSYRRNLSPPPLLDLLQRDITQKSTSARNPLLGWGGYDIANEKRGGNWTLDTPSLQMESIAYLERGIRSMAT